MTTLKKQREEMQKYTQQLVNLSVAKLWKWVSNPYMVQVKLTSPRELSNIDAILSLFPDLTRASVEDYRLRLISNHKFFHELNNNMVANRNRQTIWDGWLEFLYMAVRCCKPEIIFETGVFDGQSSAVILQALTDNDKGMLVSVDLPAIESIENSTHRMRETTLPRNCEPGWVIHDYLRERHRLVLGDSKELLPQLFKEFPTIDIFLHDSLHTFEHMYFEYTIAWPHLSAGGLLLSDDISWNPAFHKVCKEKGRMYVRLRSFGAVRK